MSIDEKVTRYWHVVVLVVCLVLAVGMALNQRSKVLDAIIEHNRLISERTELLDKDKLLTDDIETSKHKLAECAKKVADPSKRNVSDMQSYITARYSKVPIELAALISQKTNEIADEHDVDFALVVGVIDVESAFNPFAISKADARGLMQVMFKVWGKQYKITKASDLHDIGLNITVGVQILKHYINKNEGSLSKALKDYNGGGKDYARDVYVAIGRFTAFRNNTYEEKATKSTPTIPVTTPKDKR